MQTVRAGGILRRGLACLFESALSNGIPQRIIFRAPILVHAWHCEHVAVRWLSDAVVCISRAYAGARVALQLLTETLCVVARDMAATGVALWSSACARVRCRQTAIISSLYT